MRVCQRLHAVLLPVMLLVWTLARPLIAAENLAQKIAGFDERTFENPAAVVREGTELYQKHGATMSPEDIVGLAVVIAESAGLYGKSETVGEWVERGQKLIDRVNRPIERIRLYSLAGVALEFSGKSKEARASHEKAIASAVALQNLQMEAYARELFTYFANREADYLVVLQNVNRLQEIYQQIPHNLTYYTTRAAVGLFFASPFYKRYDEGIALLQESIAWFEEHHKTFLAFNNSNSLSGVYSSYKPDEGVRYGLSLIEKYPETPDMPYPKYVYDSLGNSYYKQQNYREALHYFRMSAEFWRENGDNKLYYAELMLNVCWTYIKLKDYDRAWETFEKIKSFPDGASLSNKQSFLDLQVQIQRHRADAVEELKALRKLMDVTSQYQEQQNAELSRQMAARFDLQRLEEQKKQLELLNQSKTQELERSERTQRLLILLSVLALFLLVLALLYIRKRHEAHEKQEALQEILDTIQEGIVRIGPGRRILPYYSRATQAFLGREDSLVGQEILPILLHKSNLTQDQIQLAAECLNTIIGETEENWDFNSVHLPQQIKIGPRTLSFAWQPTMHQGRVRDLVLTIVDITAHFELEEAVRLERAKNTEFHNTLSELRRVSLTRSLRLISGLEHYLEEHREIEDRVWLHTQKGIARSLGLQSLSERIHELESRLIGRPSLQKNDLMMLRQTLAQYGTVAAEIGPRAEQESGQDLPGLCSEILAGLRPLLQEQGLRLDAVTIEDRYQDWNGTRLETLRAILVHAITNSLDHGFIRGHKDKAVLRIEAFRSAGDFHLILRDNGSGLNWDHIRDLARTRGVTTEDPERLTELLFEEGVSTSQTVSALSGRGVGLAAIRQKCLKLQGSCTIMDHPDGPGTQLKLQWPELSWAEDSPKSGTRVLFSGSA